MLNLRGINITGGTISGTTIIGNGNIVVSGGNVTINGKRVDTSQVQGNGEIVSEQRELSAPFDKVEISGIAATLETGQSRSGMELKGSSNLLSQIKSEIKDGTLYVGPKEGTGISTEGIEAKLYMGDLTGITASASAVVRAANVATQNLKVKASSGGSISVKGQASNLEAIASSGGSVNAWKLEAESVVARGSSGGSLVVPTGHRLNAEASSGGSISYLGDGQVSRRTSSGGTITEF